MEAIALGQVSRTVVRGGSKIIIHPVVLTAYIPWMGVEVVVSK